MTTITIPFFTPKSGRTHCFQYHSFGSKPWKIWVCLLFFVMGQKKTSLLMEDLLLFTYVSFYMHIPPSLCNNIFLVPSLVLLICHQAVKKFMEYFIKVLSCLLIIILLLFFKSMTNLTCHVPSSGYYSTRTKPWRYSILKAQQNGAWMAVDFLQKTPMESKCNSAVKLQNSQSNTNIFWPTTRSPVP